MPKQNYISTAASKYDLEAVLMQKDTENNRLHPIYYAS